MSQRRTWAEPLDSVRAERFFSRFVRNVMRRRQTSDAMTGTEATKLVAAPNRPRRQVNETTTTIRRLVEDPDIDELRGRRLLGQQELDAILTEKARRELVVEITALYKRGHVADVVTELERIRSKYPMDIELSGMLGDFFLERGDLIRAVEMLFSMVDAHYERADPEAARRCLERIKALDPENRRLRRFEKLMKRHHT